MREKNRKPIEEMAEFPQFTTMHVIEGQAGQTIYASLNFYSLTIDNILNIIVMLILVTVTIRVATNGNLFTHAGNAVKDTKTAIRGENALLDGNVGDKTIEQIVAEQTGETPTPTLIHFTINGDGGYQGTAEAGMTWEEWVESEYNTAECFVDGDTIAEPEKGGHLALESEGPSVSKLDTIISGEDYCFIL